MHEQLVWFAEKAKTDPYFLASSLHVVAKARQWQDEQLCQHLNCTPETLLQLRLCRAPKSGPEEFHQDIEQICQRFPIQASVLMYLVREGQTILTLQAATSSTEGSPYFLAARDAEKDEPPIQGEP